MASFPREVIRWLGSLDLPFQLRHPRRDCSNGYIVAEICARYWAGVDLHQFSNGTAVATREDNWEYLRRLFERNGSPLEKATVAAIVAGEGDAARDLIVALFALFKASSRAAAAVQPVAPLQAEAVAQVPKFVKTIRPEHDVAATDLLALHQAEEARRQQKAAESQRAKEKEQAQREAAAQALDITAHAPEARRRSVVSAVPSAIRDPEQPDAAGPNVQFSGVSVRQLNATALARIGRVGQNAARANGTGAQASSAGAGEGALLELSAAVEEALGSLGVAWPLGTGGTALQYYGQHHARQPDVLRNTFWGAVAGKTQDTIKALVARPGDSASFAATFLPMVSTDLVQRRIGRAHFPLTGPDARRGAAFVRDVFLGVAVKHRAFAALVLQRHVAPIVAPSLDVSPSAPSAPEGLTAAEARALLADAVAALAGVPTGEALTKATAAHALAAPDGPRCAAAVASVYDAVVTHDACGGGAQSRAAFLDATAAFVARVGAYCAAMAEAEIEERRAEGETDIDVAPVPLPAALAASAHYHALAGLHNASPAVRAAAASVLAPLVAGGHHLLCAGDALAFVDTAFAPAGSIGAAQAHHAAPIAAELLCTMVRVLSAAEARSRAADPTGPSDDAEWREPFESRLAALLNPAVFPDLAPAAKVALVSAAGEVLGHTGTSAGNTSPRVAAAPTTTAQLFLAALEQLPPHGLSLLLATKDTAPDAAALRQCGIVEAALWAPLSCAGAPERWALRPLVSALAEPIAAAPLEAVPRQRRASTAAATPEPTAEADAAHRAVYLMAALLAPRRAALCSTQSLVPAWWAAIEPLAPSLVTACQFLRVEQQVPEEVREARPPVDDAAHGRMVVAGHRCRAIAAALYAGLSGEPHAAETAADVLAVLRPVLGDDIAMADVDAGGEATTRVDTWVAEVLGGLGASTSPTEPQAVSPDP